MNDNAGCSVVFPTAQSYGPTLNNGGGGWYVMYNKQLRRCLQLIFRFAVERNASDISVWFWSRDCLTVPLEVRLGLDIVDPLNWVREVNLHISLIVFVNNTILQGEPAANFPNTYCNIPDYFSAENIIIDLTLCKLSFLLFCSVSLSIRNRFEGGDWAGNAYPASCPSTCVGMFCNPISKA